MLIARIDTTFSQNDIELVELTERFRLATAELEFLTPTKEPHVSESLYIGVSQWSVEGFDLVVRSVIASTKICSTGAFNYQLRDWFLVHRGKRIQNLVSEVKRFVTLILIRVTVKGIIAETGPLFLPPWSGLAQSVSYCENRLTEVLEKVNLYLLRF